MALVSLAGMTKYLPPSYLLFTLILMGFLEVSASGRSGRAWLHAEPVADAAVAPSTALAQRPKNVNGVWFDHIRSVQLHQQESPLSAPYLPLGSNRTLVLRFDDLNGGYENYLYRLQHCDYDWEPTDLLPSEFISGFAELSIQDVEQSFNTFQPYTHYRAEWPNEMSRPIISGNFLLTVVNDDAPEAPVITRRIVIYENLVQLIPNVKESSIVAQRRHRQEVDFTISHAGFSIFDARRDLEVAILQNHRWDNAITGLKPVFQRTNELVYDFSEENNFDGLNEFRWFDTKTIQFAALGTDSIRDKRDGWHIYLTPARRRTYEAYRTDNDINGAFLIRVDNFDDHLEGDYAHIHFSLQVPQELPGAAIHVIGGFNDYRLYPGSRMQWNAKRQRYELIDFLKQGYYNYMITVVTPDRLQGDATIVEGNHQAAENSYTLFAYHYDPQGYYRVIGAAMTDSFNR
jgi:hypothetical protein